MVRVACPRAVTSVIVGAPTMDGSTPITSGTVCFGGVDDPVPDAGQQVAKARVSRWRTATLGTWSCRTVPGGLTSR
jgi:hypothetical protein